MKRIFLTRLTVKCSKAMERRYITIHLYLNEVTMKNICLAHLTVKCSNGKEVI